MTLDEQATDAFDMTWSEWLKKFPEANKYHHTAQQWFIQGYKSAAKGRDAASSPVPTEKP